MLFKELGFKTWTTGHFDAELSFVLCVKNHYENDKTLDLFKTPTFKVIKWNSYRHRHRAAWYDNTEQNIHYSGLPRFSFNRGKISSKQFFSDESRMRSLEIWFFVCLFCYFCEIYISIKMHLRSKYFQHLYCFHLWKMTKSKTITR